MSAEVVQTNPVVDELVTDEGSVVLVSTPSGHRIVRLSVLGHLLRDLALKASSIETLTRELQSRIGPPLGGGALELVRRAVEDLERDGLVTVRTAEGKPDERRDHAVIKQT